MKIERIPLERLQAATYNPRRDLQPEDIEYQKLQRSMEQFGYVEPIVWNQRTGNVISGHQRLKILRAAGEREIACSVVDLSLPQEKALNVALNKISGEWDEDCLAKLLQELSDSNEIGLALTGFDSTELEELLNHIHPEDIDPYINGFFEVGEENKESEKTHPDSRLAEELDGFSRKITVSITEEDRYDQLIGFLEENGYAFSLEDMA